jgi:selenocysteine lyase/cysteine desulfurase
VTFTVDGFAAGAVQEQLAAQGINTSVSRVEYAQLDLPARGLPDVVRASPHYFTTEEEVQRLVGAVASIVTR